MIVVEEHSEVHYGRTRIPYSIRRSGRRGTVAVAVEPSGEVMLTAPASTPVERLDRVVYEKARWIVGHWRRLRDLPINTGKREFVSGETFLYLGRQYRLRVRKGDVDVRLHRRSLEVWVPGHAVDRADSIQAALMTWYRQQAARRLPERVAFWSEQMGIERPVVFVREQQKRWGSCDAAGTLRFNWRSIQAPMSLVDYVVVHELVHLRHRHHTPSYWATLGRVMPDYEARLDRLRRLGPELVW